MSDRRFIGCALAATLWLGATVASAQCENPPTDLPANLLSHQGALDAGQKNQIATYVSGWLECLMVDDAAKISTARQKILQPLQISNSPTFKVEYSAALAGDLLPALDAKMSLLTRLNAMIMAREIASPTVVDLIAKGSTDANAAVRYWAGSSVCPAMAKAGLDQRQPEQDRLLKALTAALQKEKHHAVVQAMLDGLSCLTHPNALRELLTLLDGRISSFIAEPGQTPDAEAAALRRIFTTVLRNPEKVDNATKRKLAAVAWRFMAGSVQVMVGNKAPKNQGEQDAYANVFLMADGILMWVVPNIDPSLKAQLPGALGIPGTKVPWAAIGQPRVDAWKVLLDRLGIPVQAPKAKEAEKGEAQASS